jgi:hypothetical protein
MNEICGQNSELMIVNAYTENSDDIKTIFKPLDPSHV